ncbi:MAG: hypothetical protein V7L20_29105 [Nostoc sp.]
MKIDQIIRVSAADFGGGIMASCDRSEVHPEQKFFKGRLQDDFGGLYSKA